MYLLISELHWESEELTPSPPNHLWSLKQLPGYRIKAGLCSLPRRFFLLSLEDEKEEKMNLHEINISYGFGDNSVKTSRESDDIAN